MIPEKEKFIEAYEKWPPNAVIKFFFRYFSPKTKEVDKWISRWVVSILLGLFLWGFVVTILELPSSWAAIPTLTYTGMLALLGIGSLYSLIANNLRVRKIRKYLGINFREYEIAVDIYFKE